MVATLAGRAGGADSALKIRVCRRGAELRRFEQTGELLHRQQPAFIPPFPGSVAKQLGAGSVFQRLHGSIVPLLAERHGRAVGRIAAIQNRTHNRLYSDRTGFFGFFECEDDPRTAALLFAAAARELQKTGCTSLLGPYNPSINDECGLLVEGCEHPPRMGLTWNPPYYERLLLACGLQPQFDLFGYNLPLHRLELPARVGRIARRAAQRSRVRLRQIRLDRLESEMEIVHEVYNSTLSCNRGFVPIGIEELLAAASDLRAIADPALVLIAELGGRNAGVAMCLPDANQLLARTKRTPRWLRPLHFLLLLKTRRPQCVRFIIYGIAPEFRDRGLHGWLLAEQFCRSKARYREAELGWIQEDNRDVCGASELMGATRQKTWRIYRAEVAATIGLEEPQAPKTPPAR